MSRENYSSEPEEFIASLKEKLEKREVLIRKLQQEKLLLIDLNLDLKLKFNTEHKVNLELFDKVMKLTHELAETKETLSRQ